ncbi:MAG: hypothetical protein GY850_22465 [bacterium]|nr:hypothetical protein [bacterium]
MHRIREQCRKLNIGWIVSADIEGLFDNIDHKLLRGFIKRRVNDGGMLRLIGKWLNPGVWKKEFFLLLSNSVKRIGTDKPYERKLHVRIWVAAGKAAIQRVKVPPCQLPDSDM